MHPWKLGITVTMTANMGQTPGKCFTRIFHWFFQPTLKVPTMSFYSHFTNEVKTITIPVLLERELTRISLSSSPRPSIVGVMESGASSPSSELLELSPHYTVRPTMPLIKSMALWMQLYYSESQSQAFVRLQLNKVWPKRTHTIDPW